MNDVSTMTQDDLENMRFSINEELEKRRQKDANAERTKFLKSKQALALCAKMNALKEKLKSFKKVTSKVKLEVEFELCVEATTEPKYLFDECEYSVNNTFEAHCTGKVVNRKDFSNSMVEELDYQISSILENACMEVVGVDKNLHKQLQDFVDDLNDVESVYEYDIEPEKFLKLMAKVKK